MLELEKSGRLKRKLEFLPDDKTLLERKANNKFLTRPEVAILLAYCKMFLKQDILASDVPEDPFFNKFLLQAFPIPLRKKYAAEMAAHSLRREIIATQLSKYVTDQMGINYVERLQRETGATVAFIMRAFSIAESIFNLEKIWSQIEKLDYIATVATQQKLMLQIYYLIRRSTRWFLRNRKPDLSIQKTIDQFLKPVQDLTSQLPDLLTPSDKEIIESEKNMLIACNVPPSLASEIANCNILFTCLDIVEASRKAEYKISDVAQVYYSLGNCLELNWLREQMNAYSIEHQWDELARSGFRDDLDNVQRKLSISVLKQSDKKKISNDKKIVAWLEENKLLITRWQNLLADIKSSQTVAFVTYSVVLRELFDFAQAG